MTATNNHSELAHDRFWSKVDIRMPDECWEWTASLYTRGYGQFYLQGKLIGAHVYSYRSNYGDVPLGKIVCHKCNNRKCVNPQHLYAGTYKDNTADIIRTGNFHRPSPGDEPARHPKLTNEQALEIYRLSRLGTMSQQKIANTIGISRSVVQCIACGNTWGWLTKHERD